MSQLIISFNKQIIKRVNLEKPLYTIGRSQTCDIVLQERTISSHHAKIINTGEDCFLEDTNSTNGIYVNSRLVKKHLLIDNDMIKIGKYQLTFHTDVDLSTQLRQLSIHPRLIDKPEVPWLEIGSSAKQGHIILLEREQITLGEKHTGHVTIERTTRGEYLLHDSSGGKAPETTQLSDNDNFSVGDIELIFHTVE